MRTIKLWGPFLAAVAVLYGVIAALVVPAVRAHDGHFVYAMDDAYIHMAIARNVVQHGVWGVTRYQFAAASSSPLWVLLLSVSYGVGGVNAFSPLALNLVCATATLGLIDFALRQADVLPGLRLVALIVIIFFTPMPTLIVSGMEHLLHTLLTLAFALLAARSLAQSSPAGGGPRPWALWIVAGALPLVRYEALFLVFVVCALYVVRGRVRAAVGLVAIAVGPVAIFGAISVADGGFWLPNPIMIKSHLAGARTPGEAVHNVLRLFDYANLKLFYWQLLGSWSIHLVLLAIAAVSIFMARVGRGPDAWQPRQTLLIMFAGTGLLHLRLAQTGWFFRYDAYLMAFGMFVIALTVGPGVPRRLTLTRAGLLQGAAAVMLMIWFGYPAAERASNAWDQTPDAMSNIYAQHYQMAVFVQTYYTGQAVAVHDIGAVNYMADVHLLDLWGLANNDVARAVQEGTYTTQRIDQLAAQSHVKIAIVYDHLFERFGGLPDGWLNAGEWTLTHRATSTGVKVTFYAVDFNEFNRLVANLQAFSSRLPDDVAQSGFYVEWGDE